ncbi:MAG TPA: hypothetical protein DCF63_14310 [Planctomycetaceae bacterium]|nr:hypothetical protein [Planctomycetaceae bacterium]
MALHWKNAASKSAKPDGNVHRIERTFRECCETELELNQQQEKPGTHKTKMWEYPNDWIFNRLCCLLAGEKLAGYFEIA